MAKYRELLIEPTVWNTYVSAMVGGKRKHWVSLFKRCRVRKPSRDHFIKHMEAMDPRGAVTLYSHETPGNVFVYFPSKLDPADPQDAGAVTHEMSHVAYKILRQKRVHLSQRTEQAYAYLTEFLVREFWAKYQRKVCIQ